MSGVLCQRVCCHSWPELNHLRDYGDLSLYLPWERRPNQCVCLRWLQPRFQPRTVSCPIKQVWTCHTRARVHKHKRNPEVRQGHAVYQMCCLRPHITPAHTQMRTYSNTRSGGKATCVFSGQYGAVCVTWLMITQAVRAAERLCGGGLAARRVGLGLLPGLGSASA